MKQDHHSYSSPDISSIRHLALDLDIDLARKRIHGTAHYLLDHAPGQEFGLDTRSVSVESVSADGNELHWEIDRKDPILGERLTIHGLGDHLEFDIRFASTEESTALQWFDAEQTLDGEAPFLFTSAYAIHARSILPLQDTPQVRFTYAAKIRVPRGIRPVMAASRGERIQGDEASETYFFEMKQPIPSYLFAFAAGKLTHRDLSERVRVYAEPSLLDAATSDVSEIERILDAAESRVGPYLWDSFDILILPSSFPYWAMENPKVIFVNAALIDGTRSFSELLAHELAHSWMGNLITNATWDDVWLNEGFTTYLERRIEEDLHGIDRANFNASIRQEGMKDTILRFGLDHPATRLHFSKNGMDPDDVFSTIPLEKGYLFVRTLEEAVGRPAFEAFLKRYIQEFQFKSLTTNQFLDFIDASFPEIRKSVAIEDWLTRPGLPIHEFSFESRIQHDLDRIRTDFLNTGKLDAQALASDPKRTTRFLQGFKSALSRDQLTELDGSMRLSEQKNAFVVQAYLLLAIRNSYWDAAGKIEEALDRIGNLSFVKAVYTELSKSTEGLAIARRCFSLSSAKYHPVARKMIETLIS